MTSKEENVFWLSLSENEKDDCLRITNQNTYHAISFAWNHYTV